LASAVLMRGPAALRDAIAGVSDYLAEHRIPSVRDVIGAATREVRSYADLVRDSSPATQPWPWEDFR
jgi:hypothetical protein